MSTVRVAAAQTREFRGQIDAALHCAVDMAAQAQALGAALLCFPEGFLQGYLTDEAEARSHALDLASPQFAAVLAQLGGPTIVMGLIELAEGRLHNTAVVVRDGVLVGRYRKTHLLGREKLFDPGTDSPVFETAGLRFGVNICFDTNFPQAARKVADQGASLILCPANNMLPRKTAETWKHAHNAVRAERCREAGVWMLSADVVGERDGAVAWGPTAVIDPAGEVVAQLPLGEPGLLVFDISTA